MKAIEFRSTFETLNGNPPFPWQEALYKRFVSGDIPSSCALPTGLGKTSVMAVWLIALANHREKIPRRLVYVVNRRTVVDQATDEARKYRLKLPGDLSEALSSLCAEAEKEPTPLAISTLRGQFADKREWSADPSRPAIIVGTVDMIGSRLLFSGYGIGFKLKPLHAGLLGQDVLLVHDEAHLEPAFQDLLVAIRLEQEHRNEFRRFHVMELSATSRGSEVFGLTDEDRSNPEVKKRILAKKSIHLLENDDEKKLPDLLAELALSHRESNRAVLVFVRTVEAVEKIAEKLRKANQDVEMLTGTLRGKERDELVDNPVFRRFLPGNDAGGETVYLVCTSAGEVGVNISADHMVCDLSTFESMAQRFGRVNRFGARDDTRIDIAYPTAFGKKDMDSKGKIDDLGLRRQKTLDLLRKLNGDGSPDALSKLKLDERLAAFSPTPTTLPTSDILFDTWALTSIEGKLPGRPTVEAYLHGLSDDDPPRTTIAWRAEVEELTEAILSQNKLKPADVLDLYPLKPHEELSAPTYGRNKVFEQLELISARDSKRNSDKRLSAWVIDPDGSVTIYPLEKLVEKDRQNNPRIELGGRTVMLPPLAGGFSKGMLKGDEPFSEAIEYDVSDQWYVDAAKTVKSRIRVWKDDEGFAEKTKDMRLIRRIDIPSDGDNEDAEGSSWHWFTRPKTADDYGSKIAELPITWQDHTTDVEHGAKKLADVLLKSHPDLHQALVLAARFHDLGKMRVKWQRGIGNPKPEDWHAKSGKGWKAIETSDYRHEFGSLLDVEGQPEFQSLSDDLKQLVLHLIAAHHGRGRPHFPQEEAFDHEPKGKKDVIVMASEVPQRFARLQRKYGRWGLAYLESLLRAADYAASAAPSLTKKDQA